MLQEQHRDSMAGAAMSEGERSTRWGNVVEKGRPVVHSKPFTFALRRVIRTSHEGSVWGSLQYFSVEWLPHEQEQEVKWSKVKSLSRVQLSATPWAVAYQAPWSMGFSRQEYWSGLPFPSPGDLPNPGIEPGSPTLYADALPSELPGKSKSKKSRSITNSGRRFCW